MEHRGMVDLIRGGAPAAGGMWALAELLGPAATIYALDREARAVAAQEQRLRDDPPTATVLPRQADVLRPLGLPPLHGIIAANLPHFVRDQAGLPERLRAALRPSGRLLVVEYEQPLPVPWVAYPLPFTRLASLAREAGFQALVQVGTRRSPSSGRVLYAAGAAVSVQGVRLEGNNLGAGWPAQKAVIASTRTPTPRSSSAGTNQFPPRIRA